MKMTRKNMALSALVASMLLAIPQHIVTKDTHIFNTIKLSLPSLEDMRITSNKAKETIVANPYVAATLATVGGVFIGYLCWKRFFKKNIVQQNTIEAIESSQDADLFLEDDSEDGVRSEQVIPVQPIIIDTPKDTPKKVINVINNNDQSLEFSVTNVDGPRQKFSVPHHSRGAVIIR